MKQDIESKIDAFLKVYEDQQKKQNMTLQGKIVSRDATSIDFATSTGILNIPIADIDDINPLVPEDVNHKDVVEVKVSSLVNSTYKYRIVPSELEQKMPGFAYGTRTVGYTDTTTATDQGNPDATDDVINFTRHDSPPIYV